MTAKQNGPHEQKWTFVEAGKARGDRASGRRREIEDFIVYESICNTDIAIFCKEEQSTNFNASRDIGLFRR